VLEFWSYEGHYSNNLVVYAAVRHLRTISPLILTNSGVRKLLTDFSLIGRDLLARGASKATQCLCPDPEALARVDDSTQDKFITESGRTIGPNEAPVLDAKVPGTGYAVAQYPKEDLDAGAAVKMEHGEVKSGQQVYEEGQSHAQVNKERGMGAAQEQINGIHQCVF